MRAYDGAASCGGSSGAVMNFWINGLALPDFAASYARSLIPWALMIAGLLIGRLAK